MKFFIISLLSLLSFTNTFGQKKTAQIIDWKFLSHVNFEDKYYAELEAWFITPIFSEKVKAINNKRVIIKGYVIPLDTDGNLYALSAYPFSSCFFCGGAGPESVMTLKFKGKSPKFKTDDVETFTGILKLNDSNMDDFSYILEEVELVD